MRESGVPGLFFTGTDTGVGKTFVAAGVARLLRSQGHGVDVRKPVASGARWSAGRWLSDDTQRLAEAAGLPPETVTRWAFPEPVAPPLAARRHGQTLHLPEILDAVLGPRRAGDILLVEGVGGLLCPLTERDTVADLAAALGLRLIVVARLALGTLNHTLLTLEVARHRGLTVAGIVVNEADQLPHGLAEQTNVDELRRRLEVPVLAVIPHREDGGVPSELAAVDWWQLCQSPAPRDSAEK